MTDERAFQLRDIEAALVRAAARARRVAAESGTPIVIVRNGQIVEEPVTSENRLSIAVPFRGASG